MFMNVLETLPLSVSTILMMPRCSWTYSRLTVPGRLGSNGVIQAVGNANNSNSWAEAKPEQAAKMSRERSMDRDSKRMEFLDDAAGAAPLVVQLFAWIVSWILGPPEF